MSKKETEKGKLKSAIEYWSEEKCKAILEFAVSYQKPTSDGDSGEESDDDSGGSNPPGPGQPGKP